MAEARTSKQRGSKKPWLSIVAAVACVAALAALLAKSSLGSAVVLFAMVAVSFAIEAVFRRLTGRGLRA